MRLAPVTDLAPSRATAPNARNRRIDAIRGIAILSVILLHYSIWLPFSLLGLPGQVILPVVHNGYYGVSIFFVISGYLITSRVLDRGLLRFSAREFYTMRFGRIFPCLILMVGVVTAMTLLKPEAIGFDTSRHSLPKLLTYVFTFRANRYVVEFGTAGLAWDVLWSLAVEEVFYLALPPIVKALRPEVLWNVLLVALVLNGPFHRAGSQSLNDYLGCFDLIALGSLTAIVMRKFGHLAGRRLRCDSCWLGAGLILWCYLFRNVSENRVFGPSVIGLGTSLLIWASVPGKAEINVIQRGLARLGALSYELYLFHMPLLYLTLHCARQRSLYPNNLQQNALFFLLWLTLLVGLAQGMSRFYSEPLNRFIRQLLVPSPDCKHHRPAPGPVAVNP